MIKSISKAFITPMESAVNSIFQLFEKVKTPKGTFEDVCFFEKRGRLEKLLADFKIEKSGDIYDLSKYFGRKCEVQMQNGIEISFKLIAD